MSSVYDSAVTVKAGAWGGALYYRLHTVSELPLRFRTPVTLAGAGPLCPGRLAEALARAPALVAADGAGDSLLRLGRVPDAVVGDLDSLTDPAGWAARPGTRLIHLPEQETTDFEKCLYATEAPWYLGVGFTGGRTDHLLAVMHALMARPGARVVLYGESEAMALLPPGRCLRLRLPAGALVSLFPLAETTAIAGAGLRWPVEGLTMAPGRQIGTSNRAEGGEVVLGFDRPGAFVMLEPNAMPALVHALAGP